jgi:hypothetical protein
MIVAEDVDALVVVEAMVMDVDTSVVVTNLLNGVDVSNPTRSFTGAKWDALRASGGIQYINHQCEYLAGHGGRGGGDGRGAPGGCAVRAVQQHQGNSNTPIEQGNGERGHQHGAGFGRGMYQQGCGGGHGHGAEAQHGRLPGPLVGLIVVVLTLLVLPTLHKKLAVDTKRRSILAPVVSKHIIGCVRHDQDTAVPFITTAGTFAWNELDSHADTSCAGANWSFLQHTGQLCEVNPFLFERFLLLVVPLFGHAMSPDEITSWLVTKCYGLVHSYSTH